MNTVVTVNTRISVNTVVTVNSRICVNTGNCEHCVVLFVITKWCYTKGWCLYLQLHHLYLLQHVSLFQGPEVPEVEEASSGPGCALD